MTRARESWPVDRPPSPWVVRFAPLVPSGGAVLDLACGRGRHTRLFLDRGHPVVAVDVDVSGVEQLARERAAGDAPLEVVATDLEDGSPWPLAGRRFSGVVVTDYLHRPLLGELVAALSPGGVLLYETYARGNEAFGRPSNPDHLLAHGELLEVVGHRLRVVAYEDVVETAPRPKSVQRICAVNDSSSRPQRKRIQG